jgi:hypothetical protein
MLPSPAEILEAVGYGLLLPAAVAAVGLLLALRVGGGEPLGVGAGLAAGFVALAATGQTDWDFLRPKEAWDWLPALGLLAAVAAAAEQFVKWPVIVRWAGRVVVAALAAVVLVRAQSAREPHPLEPYWHGAFALAVLTLWGVLDLAVRRWPGGTVPGLLTLVAFAAAFLGERAGFLTVAQLGGVVAGALAGWTLIAWRRPLPGVCRAGAGPFAVLLPGVLFVASFNSYSDVPAASYLLLLAAPFCLGATALLQLGPSARRRALILGAATGVPLAVALVLAARA